MAPLTAEPRGLTVRRRWPARCAAGSSSSRCAAERRAHRLGAVHRRHHGRALGRASCAAPARADRGPRPLHALQGARGAGPLRRAALRGADRRGDLPHLLRATARCSASIPSTASPASTCRTGSLGQGLSVGCGLALGLAPRRLAGARLRPAERRRVQRGPGLGGGRCSPPITGWPTWSRSIDLNGMQALGHTATILDMLDMAERWARFGWDAVEVDGHDVARCIAALPIGSAARDRPAVDRGPHRARQGRLVHGGPARVALPQPHARAGRAGPGRGRGAADEERPSSRRCCELARRGRRGSSC